MADRSSQLILGALARAAADGAGLPLHGTKATPGLFPGTAPGKQAAQRCHDEGFLCEVGTRGGRPLCAITDKGLSFLLGQVSPRQVLEDFVRVLEAREGQLTQLLAHARQMQQSLDVMRLHARQVLQQAATRGSDLKGLFQEFRQSASQPPSCDEAIVGELQRWAKSGASDDYPLPDLFEAARREWTALSLGAFHDALRRLVETDRVYLHPWTGPLYDIPHPRFALLIGHEIAYYASNRPSKYEVRSTKYETNHEGNGTTSEA